MKKVIVSIANQSVQIFNPNTNNWDNTNFLEAGLQPNGELTDWDEIEEFFTEDRGFDFEEIEIKEKLLAEKALQEGKVHFDPSNGDTFLVYAQKAWYLGKDKVENYKDAKNSVFNEETKFPSENDGSWTNYPGYICPAVDCMIHISDLN